MIYIIISNVGFALMMLIVYFRYSHFRISTSLKIRDLRRKIEDAAVEKEQIAQALKAEVKLENEQVKKLLRDLDSFRKEKAEEMRLRLEAEKQIELAFQKTEEVEKRLNDWKKIQEAATVDSKNAMFKVGAEIYQKMAKSHRDESEQSREAIERNMKNVFSHLENISKDVEEFKKRTAKIDLLAQQMHNSAVNDKAQNNAIAAQPAPAKPAPQIILDEFTKRKLTNVASLMKDSGFKINKDYVLAENLDAEKLRLMLCDLIFLRDGTIHFIDFKAMRYLQEYDKTKATNKDVAVASIAPRLDKYLAYLSNPKYSAALQKLMAELGIKFSKIKIVFAVATRDDVANLKELKYFEKIQNAKIDIMDVDAVSDLAL